MFAWFNKCFGYLVWRLFRRVIGTRIEFSTLWESRERRKTLITPDIRRTKIRGGDGSKSTRFWRICIWRFWFWNLVSEIRLGLWFYLHLLDFLRGDSTSNPLLNSMQNSTPLRDYQVMVIWYNCCLKRITNVYFTQILTTETLQIIKNKTFSGCVGESTD